MRFIHVLALLLFVISCPVLAQQLTISGNITDTEGKPLPFVSVYQKNTTKGTSANIDGLYNFKADHGLVVLIYRAIGYRTVERSIQLQADYTENVMMEAESFTLKDIIIRANAEDPAFAIMRQAIKKRKHHLNEIEQYSVAVYIKGMQKLVSAPKTFLGRDMRKTLDLDSNRKGVLYLSESQSVFNFKRPGHIHEEMISSKIAGRNNAFSFNKASDVNINFYENIMLENTLSARGFISPVADNAMFYYRYKLLGIQSRTEKASIKLQLFPEDKTIMYSVV